VGDPVGHGCVAEETPDGCAGRESLPRPVSASGLDVRAGRLCRELPGAWLRAFLVLAAVLLVLVAIERVPLVECISPEEVG